MLEITVGIGVRSIPTGIPISFFSMLLRLAEVSPFLFKALFLKYLLIIYPNNTPIKEARVPKTTSGQASPVTRFAIRQPIVTPATAAGVKKGSTLKASASLT